jgi:hypothetical protein
MKDGLETRKGVLYTFILGSGALLLLSLVLLYTWLSLFFTTATSRGGSICWGTGCDEAAWQAALARRLGRSFGGSGPTLKPFLVVFHISLIIFIIRSGQRETRAFLPLEFGMLNMLWMLAGTAAFVLVYFGYRAATPSPQYPIIVPLATAEGAPESTPSAGTETTPDGPYLLITGPAPPPSDGCVIADETGWSVFDPDDRRCTIGTKMPYWVYGKKLAWSGLLASILVALGLSISLATGWLNRLIRRWSKTTQLGIAFTTFGLAVVCALAEFHVFGSHLLW